MNNLNGKSLTSTKYKTNVNLIEQNEKREANKK